MPTLCDICRDPGACCRGFRLNVWISRGATPEEAGEQMRERTKEQVGAPFPFEAIQPEPPGSDDANESPWDFWKWSCPKLAPDGRCSIYENRPAVCRQFEAGSDKLCTMAGLTLTRAERDALGDAAPPPTIVDRIVMGLRGQPL